MKKLSIIKRRESKPEVMIVGAGWYGCHLALKLQEKNYRVTLVEKEQDLFLSVSGTFGVRIHAGPHYPRSVATRVSAKHGFRLFHREYKDAILFMGDSIYSLGNSDAAGLPPKVSKQQFKDVCNENIIKMQTDEPSQWGFNDLQYAAKIYEPSAFVGTIIREKIRTRLSNNKINICYNSEVTGIKIKDEKVYVYCNNQFFRKFDYLVNATGYQAKALIPKNIKLPFEVKYQACLGLVYEDLFPESNLGKMSFIVLDGLFPCMMPYVGDLKHNNQYLLTHGSWTILGTKNTPKEAYQLINSLEREDIEKIKQKTELAMTHFYPAFSEKYQYIGFKSGVLAKLRTEKEFRSAITFKTGKVIHIFPGKISNIFDASSETEEILLGNNLIDHENGFSYVKGGVLDKGMSEITELPSDHDKRNTCSLQTLDEQIKGNKTRELNQQAFFTQSRKTSLHGKETLKNMVFTPKL